MLAMQYSIALPVDYDAKQVRKRVETRRQLFDGHAGLVHKSFLYNEREKLYAPFYVWKDVTQARDFLLDDLFKGVTQTFTRHRVRSWYVAHMAYGNQAIGAEYARREIDVIPAEACLATYAREQREAQMQMACDKNLYMHLVAVDADRWEVLHFSLWKDKATAAKPAGDTVIEYDVLHVSEPLNGV